MKAGGVPPAAIRSVLYLGIYTRYIYILDMYNLKLTLYNIYNKIIMQTFVSLKTELHMVVSE